MKKNKRYYWLGHDESSDQDRFFVDALDKTLWERGDEKNWDTCWYTGMPDNEVFEQLHSQQTINHIPGNNAITIKSNLYDTLMSAKQRLAGTADEARFDFFPETFSMPEDYFRFQQTALKEPEQLWIKKPKNLSRGRGIDMVRYPATVPLGSEWIIQRYLSNPHLCQGRKYVLRCYVLITSVEPLRFYWYQDGFAKLASETYSTDDLDNLYRHLTNPDINEQNEEAESAVTFISFKKYSEWLASEGHDADAFFEQLKEMIRLTIIATREAMRKRVQEYTESTDHASKMQGCYELIGLDCMVDDNIKPWIIECNLSPSLSTYADPEAGADDEVVAKRDMVTDLVNILGLNTPSTTEQPLSSLEKAAQEKAHAGKFECLFPTRNANNYFPIFPIPRYLDITHTENNGNDSCSLESQHLQLSPNSDSDYGFSDSMSIFSVANKVQQQATQCISPNEIATWIWLKNSEGQSPDDTIRELTLALPLPEGMSKEAFHHHIATQVWDVLADWSHANVFTKALSAEKRGNKASTSLTVKNRVNGRLLVAGEAIALTFFCPHAAQYLHGFYQTVDNHQDNNHAAIDIDIIQTHYGYSLTINRHQSLSGLTLSELLPTLYRVVSHHLSEQKNAAVIEASVAHMQGKNILLLNHNTDDLDNVAYQLSLEGATINNRFLLSEGSSRLTAINEPLKVPVNIAINTAHKNSREALATITAENSRGIFHYSEIESDESDQHNRIDAVVFITKNTTEITKADVLKHLWEQSRNTTQAQAKLIADWLEGEEESETHKGIQPIVPVSIDTLNNGEQDKKDSHYTQTIMAAMHQ